MKPLLFPTFIVLLIASSGTVEVQADTPFFWDDFDRDSLTEGGAGWQFWKTSDPGAFLADGNLVLRPSQVGSHTHVFTVTPRLDNYSVRTQLRFGGGTTAWAGIVSATLLDGEAEAVFWGGVQPNGIMSIGSQSDDENVVDDWQDVLDPLETLRRDIQLQYDVVGNEILFYVWFAGEHKPDEPQLRRPQPDFETSNSFALRYQWYADDGGTVEPVTIPYFAVLPVITGDYNGNGTLDVEDIEMFSGEFRGAASSRVFDLNGDGSIMSEDRDVLIREVFGTWYGDSNLDGEFNSTDLVLVFQAGEYEDTFADNSRWSTGDWDGDGDFGSTDLVRAFQDGGFEHGAKTAVAPVPEPRTAVVMLAGWIGAIWGLRRSC